MKEIKFIAKMKKHFESLSDNELLAVIARQRDVEKYVDANYTGTPVNHHNKELVDKMFNEILAARGLV